MAFFRLWLGVLKGATVRWVYDDATEGAAGTFILLLLWVYYSTLIFLYGAEVARIRRDRRQHRTHAARMA
jgi:uncharacterized BrkB/YihY/UPF0761 family membrane protein